jgi:hypothetical protein
VLENVSQKHDMHFFTTYNEETKASIVESFNRTLKTKMWKYFTHRETLTYVDVLGLLVVSGKEVHVVFFEKRLKYPVDKFSSFVCL